MLRTETVTLVTTIACTNCAQHAEHGEQALRLAPCVRNIYTRYISLRVLLPPVTLQMHAFVRCYIVQSIRPTSY